jgi:hypothetical protein
MRSHRSFSRVPDCRFPVGPCPGHAERVCQPAIDISAEKGHHMLGAFARPQHELDVLQLLQRPAPVLGNETCITHGLSNGLSGIK